MIQQDFIFIRKGKNNEKVFYIDILYIEAAKKYSKIVTLKNNYLVLAPLCEIENQLPSLFFCRIHKSYVVSLWHISYFNTELVNISSKQIPVGRQYREVLFKSVRILCSNSS